MHNKIIMNQRHKRNRQIVPALFFSLTLLTGAIFYSNAKLPDIKDDPGEAVIETDGDKMVMANKAIRFELANYGRRIVIKSYEDVIAQELLVPDNNTLFEIILPDGNIINSNAFMVVKPPAIVDLNADRESSIAAERLPGKKLTADFEHQELGLSVHWEAHLRDGSKFVCQIFTFTSKEPVDISAITLIRIPAESGVTEAQSTDCAQMMYNNMFFAIDDPSSLIELHVPDCDCLFQTTDLIATLPLPGNVTPSDPFTVSTFWGKGEFNPCRKTK